MTLLLINYEYPPIGAGAANATRQLALAFRALGHEVVVVSSGIADKRGYSIEDDVHVYRLNSKREKISSSNMREMLSFVFTARRHLGSIIKKHQPERAMLFFSIPTGMLGPYLRRHKVPYLIALRGGDVPGMERGISKIHSLIAPLRRHLMRRAIAVVANSKGLALASEKADPGIAVGMVPNGVDCDFYSPAPELRGSRFRLLFVGRFQEQKNLLTVLERFAAISPRTDAELRIIGDGPLRPDIEQSITTLSLSDRVEILPWQNKEGLRREYQSAHALINFSHYEGMPNVVLEAMACALPIVASRIMGHEELIDDGQHGYLVALHESQKLDEALLQLMQNAELCSQMGQAARTQVEENYSWKAAADQFVDLLQEKT
jgi:glycosyltransferase involved in cell wall biosynthesis